MTQFHGSDGVVKVGANVIAEVKSVDWNEAAETYQTNEPTINDPAPATTHKPGATSWDGSITCLWDDTDTTGQEAMSIGAEVAISFLPEGSATGQSLSSGNIIIISLGRSLAVDGMVQRTFGFKGNGVLAHGVAA